ncbi:hypothetical protein LCGC14_2014630 [marine sediment metagenome]|uniref:DUF1643 domain-containing protein n=1 Tax=marine sediment metagenome TaxID=412755 RepID=A0A0F9EZB7_9ZZZZ
MIRIATFSEDRKYRYILGRQWGDGPWVTFIMLNPSTANEAEDDPTIRTCIAFTQSWGYGGLNAVNLFGFVASNVKDLYAAADPDGPMNDVIRSLAINRSQLSIAAWGNPGSYRDAGKNLIAAYPGLKCLTMTKQGQPGHPLYLPRDLQPREIARI